MTVKVRLVVVAALLSASPLLVHAACDTGDARQTTLIRYSQAMAAWQENDPILYEAAKDQLHADAAAARRRGELQLCQFREKAIRQSHKRE